MIRWALKLSEFNIEWEHRPGTQNVVADVLSRNPVDNVEGSQISCAAFKALALNSREQIIQEQREDSELGYIYRYLKIPDDGSVNATVCEECWKLKTQQFHHLEKRKKDHSVNVDQVRVYYPRNSETNSYDSINELIYEGKGSSHWSNRSNSEKSRRSRKSSGSENKSSKSDKGNAGLEDLRVKRSKAVELTESACTATGAEKRGVPSSISSRSRKHMRKNTNKHPPQELEVLPGQSNQGQMRRLSPPKEESSREARMESGKEPLQRTRRTTGGAEEYGDRQPATEQLQEKEPQYGSSRRRFRQIGSHKKSDEKDLHQNGSEKPFSVNRFLASKNIPVVPQPPYLPDLSPCDFFLFPKLKNHFKGCHFGTLENIQMAVTDQLRAIPISDFHQCYEE
ncbi:uncharacterized protein TNCV_3631891 [Trichonephila clavipes]|nr:uncharacterized protein TNCV_3631891 [Trichonephila clavipes]